MSAHVLIAPAVQGRWQETFEDLFLAETPQAALCAAQAGSLLWVDIAQREALVLLRRELPGMPLVALTLNPGTEEAIWAFEAGARGYCHALAVPEMLRQVALVVSHGGLWLGPDLMQRTAIAVARLTPPEPTPTPDSPLDLLTPRERDVALQVAGGAANKEVARRLDITPRTVKAHMGAIFDKLGVRDRLQLVLLLRRSGTPLPSGN